MASSYPRDTLLDLLRPAVASDQAERAFAGAARRCGVDGDPVDFDDAKKIFGLLAEGSGLVGLAARLAHARLRMLHLQERLEVK